jgi:hypothetical protein
MPEQPNATADVDAASAVPAAARAPAPGFVHLRVHSAFSIVDSIVRIDALAQAARDDRQPRWR